MILRWLHAPMPATRLAMLRILVAGYCVVFLVARWPSFWGSADLPRRQWEAVGVLWFLDAPPSPSTIRVLLLLTVVALASAVLGWRWRITGPVAGVLFLVVAGLRMSWGHVIHTEHLAALHLVVVATAAGAADAWSLDARRRPGHRTDSDRYGVPIRLMSVCLVLTYVLAGWMTVRNGGWDWLTGDVLRNQIAYDNLRKELLGSPHSPLGGWIVGVPAVFHPIAWVTVIVEIGAPLALLGGRVRTVWAVAAWGFHVGIVALMAISFPYPLSGIAYACLFPVERIGDRIKELGEELWQRSGTMERWRLSRTDSTTT